jgi:hypothetical protein
LGETILKVAEKTDILIDLHDIPTSEEINGVEIKDEYIGFTLVVFFEDLIGTTYKQDFIFMKSGNKSFKLIKTLPPEVDIFDPRDEDVVALKSTLAV